MLSSKLATSASEPSGVTATASGSSADGDAADDRSRRDVDLDELVLTLDGHEDVLPVGGQGHGGGQRADGDRCLGLRRGEVDDVHVSPGLATLAPGRDIRGRCRR